MWADSWTVELWKTILFQTQLYRKLAPAADRLLTYMEEQRWLQDCGGSLRGSCQHLDLIKVAFLAHLKPSLDHVQWSTERCRPVYCCEVLCRAIPGQPLLWPRASDRFTVTPANTVKYIWWNANLAVNTGTFVRLIFYSKYSAVCNDTVLCTLIVCSAHSYSVVWTNTL